jgi:hypothetical protein
LGSTGDAVSFWRHDDHVAALLEAERPITSWINLREVLYGVGRAASEQAAMTTLVGSLGPRARQLMCDALQALADC